MHVWNPEEWEKDYFIRKIYIFDKSVGQYVGVYETLKDGVTMTHETETEARLRYGRGGRK